MRKRLLFVAPGDGVRHATHWRVSGLQARGYDPISVASTDGKLELLPAAIEHARRERGDCDRLVVLTTRRDWALAWARAYPELVDDYVWALEPLEERGTDVRVAVLASLSGVEPDAAKVHVDLRWDSYALAIAQVLRYPQAFRPLSALDHDRCVVKRLVPRNFSLKAARVSQQAERAAHGLPPVVEDADAPAITTASLLQHPWLWAFAVARSAEAPDDELKRAVDGLLGALAPDRMRALAAELSAWEEHAVLAPLLLRAQQASSDAPLRALFAELAALDDAKVARAYPVVASTVGDLYESRSFRGMEGARERLLTRTAAHFTRDAKLAAPARTAGRIALLAMQLKEPPHAATKNLLAYVENLRRFAPHLEPSVILTDDLTPAPAETMVDGTTVSVPSLVCRHVHERLAPGLPVHYPDPNVSRAERARAAFDALARTQPDVVVAFGAEVSLLRPLVFGRYPVLSLTMGGPPGVGLCDVYAGPNDPAEVRGAWAARGLELPAEIRRHSYGMDLPEPKKTITRDQLGLEGDDFVMCSVGNRLDEEISAEMLDAIEPFLMSHPRARWLLVGRAEHPLVRARPAIWSRARVVPFEPDLPALYERCDVYLNPPRRGGGHSVSLAMSRAVPVVSLLSSNDAMIAIGDTGGSDDLRACARELTRLHDDPGHRAHVGATMRERVRTFFGWERTVHDLIELIDLTRTTFQARPAGALRSHAGGGAPVRAA